MEDAALSDFTCEDVSCRTLFSWRMRTRMAGPAVGRLTQARLEGEPWRSLCSGLPRKDKSSLSETGRLDVLDRVLLGLNLRLPWSGLRWGCQGPVGAL